MKPALNPQQNEISIPADANPMSGPHHVAIIMDGNGRWAQMRNRPRSRT